MAMNYISDEQVRGAINDLIEFGNYKSKERLVDILDLDCKPEEAIRSICSTLSGDKEGYRRIRSYKPDIHSIPYLKIA